jgi:hypothetical protein
MLRVDPTHARCRPQRGAAAAGVGKTVQGPEGAVAIGIEDFLSEFHASPRERTEFTRALARQVRANPDAYPAHVAVYFGPLHAAGDVRPGDSSRARLGLVKVITGATHKELLVAYQALDQRQPEYPKEHGQRISVRCGGRVVIDTA